MQTIMRGCTSFWNSSPLPMTKLLSHIPMIFPRYYRRFQWDIQVMAWEVWSYELQIPPSTTQGWDGGRNSINQIIKWSMHWMCSWEASRAKPCKGDGKESHTTTWVGKVRYDRSYFHSIIWYIKVWTYIYQWLLKILLGVLPQIKVWSFWKIEDLEGIGRKSEWA